MPVATSNLKIRTATPDDLGIMRSLYKHVWGYNRPLRFDYWRYFATPSGFCPITLAFDANHLSGAYTVWPVNIRMGNTVIQGAQSMDTMVHPDYQGRGIFSGLAEACYEEAASRGYKVLYGFPNPLSYPGFVHRLGWIHAGDVAHWVRPIKPSKHHKVPRALAPIVDMGVNLLPKGNTTGLEVQIGKPENHDMSRLMDHWYQKTAPCQIDRSKSWLDWRYSEEMCNDYQWISIYRRGTLVATGAWGMKSSEWGGVADDRAHLVECFGDSPSAIKAVLSVAINASKEAGAILLETICNTSLVCKQLKGTGFYCHRQAPFIVKELDGNRFGVEQLSSTNWSVIGGDVDTF